MEVEDEAMRAGITRPAVVAKALRRGWEGAQTGIFQHGSQRRANQLRSFDDSTLDQINRLAFEFAIEGKFGPSMFPKVMREFPGFRGIDWNSLGFEDIT